MKNLPHPIQYQGSKRHLASMILRYFPKEIDCLIEPFAGSAEISIAAFFSSYDYKDVLSMAGTSDLVYMDPPYQGVCGERDSRYFSGVSYREFTEQLDKLNAEIFRILSVMRGAEGTKLSEKCFPIFSDCTGSKSKQGARLRQLFWDVRK